MQKELDLAIGFAMFDSIGKAVLSGQERKIYSANTDLPIRYEIAVGVDPGTYRMRLAAVDLGGKSGSVEREVVAFGMANHELAIGDLILSSVRQGKAGDLRAPVVLRVTDGMVGTYTEIYTNKPGALDETDVVFEVADSADGPALQSTLADLRERADRMSIQALGLMPVAALPPGRYIARAVITRDGKNVGKLTRPFEVLPGAKGATSGTGATGALGARAGRQVRTGATGAPGATGATVECDSCVCASPGLVVAAKPAPFKKEDVLTPAMLRATFDAVDKNHPAVKAATTRARTGKLDGTAMMALDAGDQNAGALLRGVELFIKGQLDPAANQFSVALRNPPDAPACLVLSGGVLRRRRTRQGSRYRLGARTRGARRRCRACSWCWPMDGCGSDNPLRPSNRCV